jgi:hypothetical protein
MYTTKISKKQDFASELLLILIRDITMHDGVLAISVLSKKNSTKL